MAQHPQDELADWMGVAPAAPGVQTAPGSEKDRWMAGEDTSDVGFFEAATTTVFGERKGVWDWIPFVATGREGIGWVDMYQAGKAFNLGTATADQRDMLEKFLDWHARERGFAGGVGEIAGGLPVMAVEFGTGLGIATIIGKKAMATAAGKALQKALTRMAKTKIAGALEENVATRTAGKLIGAGLAGAGVGVVSELPRAPWGRVMANARRLQFQRRFGLDRDEAGQLVLEVLGDPQSLLDVLPVAIVDELIEYGSEMTGGAIPFVSKLDALHDDLLALFFSKKGLEAGRKFLKKYGIGRVFEEIGEEYLGAAAREAVGAVAGVEEFKGALPDTFEQTLEMYVAFGLRGGVGAARGAFGEGVDKVLEKRARADIEKRIRDEAEFAGVERSDEVIGRMVDAEIEKIRSSQPLEGEERAPLTEAEQEALESMEPAEAEEFLAERGFLKAESAYQPSAEVGKRSEEAPSPVTLEGWREEHAEQPKEFHEWLDRFWPLAVRTAESEKHDMPAEDVQKLIDETEDWRAFSKARGYTEEETEEFGRYIESVAEGQQYISEAEVLEITMSAMESVREERGDEATPSVIMTEIRDSEGDVVGYETEPYDGTTKDSRRAQAVLQKRVAERVKEQEPPEPGPEPTIPPELKGRGRAEAEGVPPIPPAEVAEEGPEEPVPPETGEALLNRWIKDRDVSRQKFRSRAAQQQEELREIVGKRTPGEVVKEAAAGTPRVREREMAAAVKTYIDIKEGEAIGAGTAEEQLARWSDKMTAEQKAEFKASQNLSPELQALAEESIAESKALGIWALKAAERKAMGLEVLGPGVLKNVRDNYSARMWVPREGEEPGPQVYGKFTMSTARAKARTYESVLEGWAKGRELAITGYIEAQMIASEQVAQAVHDRKFVREAIKAGLLSPSKQTKDAELVEHPTFKDWVPAGKAVEGETYGAGIYINEEGTILQEVPLFAPKHMAQALNNILGKSRLKGTFWDTVTKWNAIFKHLILSLGFFHHQAFIRSYVFGTHGIEGFRPIKNYFAGRKAILYYGDELQLLVGEGLTIGRVQDFSEMLAKEKTRIGAIIDKIPVAREAKNILIAVRDYQTDFLFRKLGANLKVMSALHEFHRLLKKHDEDITAGKMTREEVARIAAKIANADFGGLNLARMRRDPTKQHIMRLMLLAPDWTESNVQSMLSAFGISGFGNKVESAAESAAYRAMWYRVFARAGLLTVAFQLAMAAMDDEEEFWDLYQRQYKEGKLRWLSVDVTPLAKAVGFEIDNEERKFFSVLGHFRDPIKFVFHPIRSLKHKSSVVAGTAYEAISGRDWAGRRFTSWSELTGLEDPGVYLRSGRRPDGTRYRRGEEKPEQATGKTVTWGFGSHPLEYPQLPSFILNQSAGVLPIQVQNSMAFLLGELDGFDALTKSLGLMTATTYPTDE